MPISFLATLSAMCQAPAVDNSDILAQEANVELLQDAMETGYDEYLDKLDDALVSCGFTVEMDSNGVVTAVRKDTSSTTTTTPLMTINGITTLQAATGPDPRNANKDISMPLVDEYDAEDYASRYTSLDFRPECEDGSGISFLRIIDVKTRETVFPNFSPTNVPGQGLTPSKFKQFILTQINTASQERMQIVETNEAFQVIFADQKPQVLQLSGVLKNTADNPWTMNMVFLWDSLMRGTRLVEQDNICQLYIDGELFSGYPFAFQRSKTAGNDILCSFSMSFLVRSRQVVSGYNGVNYGRAV